MTYTAAATLPPFDLTGPPVKSGAVYSDCDRYRYRLWRTWGDGEKVGFVMLNPSTATHEASDPTVTRCINYALSWGYAGLEVVNIFALRSTDPKALKRAVRDGEDPIGGPENDAAIRTLADRVGLIVCGWGNHGELNGRGAAVLEMLWSVSWPHYLKLTQAGNPWHPLYLGRYLKPRPMASPEDASGK